MTIRVRTVACDFDRIAYEALADQRTRPETDKLTLPDGSEHTCRWAGWAREVKHIYVVGYGGWLQHSRSTTVDGLAWASL